jgi:hypothetical protein
MRMPLLLWDAGLWTVGRKCNACKRAMQLADANHKNTISDPKTARIVNRPKPGILRVAVGVAPKGPLGIRPALCRGHIRL